MELQFTFEGEDPVKKAIAFKTFVEEHKLSGINSIEMQRAAPQPGDQGIGKFLGSIITSIVGSSDTIKSIVKVLSKFLELFDGRITIKNNKGETVTIPGGKKLSAEQIENIAIQFTKRK